MDSTLTDEEVKAIALAVVSGAGEAGAEEAHIMRAVRWAEAVRHESTLLDLVLSGDLHIVRINPPGMAFRAARQGQE